MHAAKLAMPLFAMTMVAGSAAGQGPQRESAPHVHGTGRLNIAIEGTMIALDLDMPALDIVGFEHAPDTPEQKAMLAKARATMMDAASIFRMTPEAGCTVAKAEADLEQPDKNSPDAAAQNGHADFAGAFEFNCSAIDKLKFIDLGFFAAFPRAQKLEISIVTPKIQTISTATRDAPRIDLSGLN